MAMLVQPDVAHEHRYRACRRADGLPKRGYSRRQDARRALGQARARLALTTMDIYRCNQCGLFHIGHRGTP